MLLYDGIEKVVIVDCIGILSVELDWLLVEVNVFVLKDGFCFDLKIISLFEMKFFKIIGSYYVDYFVKIGMFKN